MDYPVWQCSCSFMRASPWVLGPKFHYDTLIILFLYSPDLGRYNLFLFSNHKIIMQKQYRRDDMDNIKYETKRRTWWVQILRISRDVSSNAMKTCVETNREYFEDDKIYGALFVWNKTIGNFSDRVSITPHDTIVCFRTNTDDKRFKCYRLSWSNFNAEK